MQAVRTAHVHTGFKSTVCTRMHKCPEGTHHRFSLGGGLRGWGWGKETTVFCPVCFLCIFRVISVTGKISAALKMFSHV